MAAPKAVKKLGAATPSAQDLVAAQYDPPAVPLDDGSVWQAIVQLQNTVNDLITRFNAHTHGGVTTGAGTSGAPNANTMTGAGSAAANLFTTS